MNCVKTSAYVGVGDVVLAMYGPCYCVILEQSAQVYQLVAHLLSFVT